MMKLSNYTVAILVFCLPLGLTAQMESYQYRRDLLGITDQWHRIVLPDEIFQHLSSDLSDIRIYGMTESQDTVEAPYIVRIGKDIISSKTRPVKQLNTSRSDKGFFYTYELPINTEVNRLALDIKQDNFDWRIVLEGSHEQQDWFTLTEDYRILSIKNKLTDYQFTEVVFPTCDFPYLRLNIKSEVKPIINDVRISFNKKTGGKLNQYKLASFTSDVNKKTKQSTVDINLAQAVPVSRVKIDIHDQVDFYRPIAIQYLLDSIKTEKGWKYNYRTIGKYTVSQLEENDFYVPSTRAQKLRIVFEDHDNQPLTVGSVSIWGYEHALVSRLTPAASYSMYYGNNKASKSQYDIGHFKDAIPDQLTDVTLGPEQVLISTNEQTTGPLFKNKLYLYAVMLIIIAVLGWFTMKMMRKGE